jgi:hypothetical protein
VYASTRESCGGSCTKVVEHGCASPEAPILPLALRDGRSFEETWAELYSVYVSLSLGRLACASVAEVKSRIAELGCEGYSAGYSIASVHCVPVVDASEDNYGLGGCWCGLFHGNPLKDICCKIPELMVLVCILAEVHVGGIDSIPTLRPFGNNCCELASITVAAENEVPGCTRAVSYQSPIDCLSHQRCSYMQIVLDL